MRTTGADIAIVRKTIPITAAGLQKLRDELTDLKTRARPEAAARIQQTLEDSPGARSEGEGEETKAEQGLIESRIRELEVLIANSELIDERQASKSGIVMLGSTVTVRPARHRTDRKYMIVGPAEVDPGGGRVSDESPVGQALLGAKVGDTVEVQAPAGVVKLHVRAIE